MLYYGQILWFPLHGYQDFLYMDRYLGLNKQISWFSLLWSNISVSFILIDICTLQDIYIWFSFILTDIWASFIKTEILLYIDKYMGFLNYMERYLFSFIRLDNWLSFIWTDIWASFIWTIIWTFYFGQFSGLPTTDICFLYIEQNLNSYMGLPLP